MGSEQRRSTEFDGSALGDASARKTKASRYRRRFSRKSHDHPAPDSAVRRATAASALGNATEWYDYGIYAVATSYIASHFFAGFSNATLLTLATFAISFLVRPIGGLVWGPLGDRLGRKAVLATTILMMSGATFLIGVLPTAEQVGILAPILLITLRLVQGFSTGGEYGGAATYMAEYAPDHRRGFFGSFLEFGTIAGFALGTGLMLLMEVVLTPDQMSAFGWRIPFLLAAPIGLVGFYLRSRLDDTPVFTELDGASTASIEKDSASQTDSSETDAAPGIIGLIRDHWRTMLVMSGLVIAVNVVNYTLLTYMPTYLNHQIGLSSTMGLTVVLIGQLAMMALMPVVGRISDHTGRKPVWYFSLTALTLMAIPMFKLIGFNFGFAIVGFAALALLYIPQLSTITATFPSLFPTQARYSGFAITYNVATSIFGGTAAMVNEWAIGVTGDIAFPAYYMMAACLIGLVCVWHMPETAGASLRGTAVPGTLGSAVAEGSPAEQALEECRQPEQRSMEEHEMLEVTQHAIEEAEAFAEAVAATQEETAQDEAGEHPAPTVS
ncbi:MFS transporter [Ancrocorticia populi]|uniref:MFS transporter n=1 Tax=Ancrocorticia populi TaxID=2175228 RepID=UPI003F8FFF45